uniref:Double-strand-break repair protein rad21 n=1 Tax=Aceria tosichella TaxID=561515 RepID=A0A6G1S709_9ACAR
MFYSVFVLGKKGPLARVWLAAHWDRKITRSQILETNIVESVDSILEPRIKLSLRTSSHLLLGIVRIYARKTIYLLQDCQDAAFKIKSAFRPGAVDLPEGKQEANVNAITLPEMLDFVTNFDLIEPPTLIEPVVNTTNHRNITLAEDVAMTDDTFLSGYQWGGMGAANNSEVSAVRNASNVSGAKALQQLDANLNDDGFGGELGVAPLPDDEFFQVDIDADGAPKGEEIPSQTQQPDRPMSRASVAGSDISAANSMADSGPPSTPGGAGGFGNDDIDNVQGPFDSMRDMDGVGDENAPPTNGDSRINNGNLPTIPEEGQENVDQSLPDSMVLDPVIQDAQGMMPRRKRRRRLGIIIDEVKTLSGEEIKAQLSDTKDIVTALDLAPPTKQLMEVKRSANVDKLFTQPECHILSKVLIEHYTRNLISSKLDHDTAEGELPSMARPDGFNNNSFNGHMDSFAPSFGYDGDMSGANQDVSYLMDNQGDMSGGDYPLPKTPKTPGANRGSQQSQAASKSGSPKKKRSKTDTSSDQLIDPKQRSATKQPHDQPSELGDMGFNESYNNNNITADDDDGPTDDPMNVGETEEQYEERIRNRRTHILLQLLGPRLDEEGALQFSQLCRNYRRKQVAQNFFSLLVLKKQQAIDLVQEETGNSYGELYISKGPKFNAVPTH